MKTLALMEIVKAVYAIDYTAQDRNLEINNVEFDSRKIVPGSLFIPLVGGNTDGHSYVARAIAQGAVATLWSGPAEEAPSDQIAVIFVDDTLVAMQKLAAYYRTLINPIVVGITGSNGKTTTKDMTAATLAAKYRVHKTQGNFNNGIGMPYTLLQMAEDTQVLVVEMGMNHFGEIEHLSQLAQPDIAAITLIGESHLEYLGSREGIAKAKLEILAGLKPEGLFIYPGDEPLIQSQWPTLNRDIQQQTFGLSEQNDVYAYDLVEEQSRTYFKTNLDENVTCMIPVLGSYNVTNALIALMIAKALAVPIEQAIFKLAQFELSANRLEWLKTQQGAALLNDAYNASPTSVKAVLGSFSALRAKPGTRKLAVLGDIRELGSESASLHVSLKAALDPSLIEFVYLFGPEMRVLYDALQQVYAPDKLFYEQDNHQRLITALQIESRPDDLILIKSSFGTDLLQVVTALTGHETH